MAANVREAHYTPVTIRSFVSKHGGLLKVESETKVETHNIVAAVQKLLQGDLVSLVLPYNRRWRTVGLL